GSDRLDVSRQCRRIAGRAHLRAAVCRDPAHSLRHHRTDHIDVLRDRGLQRPQLDLRHRHDAGLRRDRIRFEEVQLSARARGVGDRARRQGRGGLPAVAAVLAGKPRHLLLQRARQFDHGARPHRPVLAVDPGGVHAAAHPAGAVVRSAKTAASAFGRHPPGQRAPLRPAGVLEYCIPAMNSGDRNPRPASVRGPSAPLPAGAAISPRVEPIGRPDSFKSRAYAALKDAIAALDVYRSRTDIRLDERRLASDFGVSRTPIREAMAQLEREGFVRSVPRRGVYVVRKTRREVIELITAWAALESMAARLPTQRASDEEIATLRGMFATFENGKLRAHLDEYSEVNIEFHQTIIRLSRNQVLIDLAENLFTHMRMIRRTTIGEQDRADRSIRDHMNIIEALEARATDRAEELVRDHALGLADHVSRYADYLD